jgi:hypothetical protein
VGPKLKKPTWFASILKPDFVANRHKLNRKPSIESSYAESHAIMVSLRPLSSSVVLHYIWQTIPEEHCAAVETTASSSRFVMKWSFFLNVWYESTAQLLADGVPVERIFIGGVFDVFNYWNAHKKMILECIILPEWTYDPSLDTLHKTDKKYPD